MTAFRRSLPRWLVTIAALVAIVCTLRQLWTTDLGMDERLVGEERIVTEVDADGPAARAGIVVGDVILHDPGIITYVKPWSEREIFEWNRGLKRAIDAGVVPVVIRHDGSERTVVLHPSPAPTLSAGLRQLRRLAPYIPTSFAFIGIASLLAWTDRRSKRSSPASDAADRARVLVVASFACYGPCWVIEWTSPGWPSWLYVVASFLDVWSASTAVVLQVYFAWSYPTKANWIDRPSVQRAVIAIGIVACTISMTNSLGLIDVPRPLHGNALSIWFDSVAGITSLVGFGWQYTKSVGIVARRQAAWILGTMTIAMLVPIGALMVPTYVLGIDIPMMHYVLFQFPMLMPLGIAVAVGRYRLFALDGLALRIGPYAVTTVTSLVVCITVAASIQMVFGWRTATTGEASRWLGVIVAVAIGEPLRRLSQRTIDRLFARDPDAFLRRCAVLSAKLARAEDEATMEAEVTAGLETTATILELESVLPADAANDLARVLATSGVLRTRDVRDSDVMDALIERNIAWLVAIPAEGGTAAGTRALTLSATSFGAWLGRAERDALASLGLVIGASLTQRETKRALESERLRAENERRHIAMELHDGIGATLTAARLMTRRLREPEIDREGEVLEALDATLRRGLGDLRTSLWSLDAKNVGWDALVATISRHANDVCSAAGIDVAIATEGSDTILLSPAMRLGIFRTVQEAITNAVKHAAPRRIDLDLRATYEAITVVVENDGKSMQPMSAEGRGLANMSRRIEALGGTIDFSARTSGGTRVQMTLPLPTATSSVTAAPVPVNAP